MPIQSLVELAHIPYIPPPESHPWRSNFDVMWQHWYELNRITPFNCGFAYEKTPPLRQILWPLEDHNVTSANSTIAWLSSTVGSCFAEKLLAIARYPVIDDSTRNYLFNTLWEKQLGGTTHVVLHVCNDYCTTYGHAYAPVTMESKRVTYQTLLWCLSEDGVNLLEQFFAQRRQLLSR